MKFSSFLFFDLLFLSLCLSFSLSFLLSLPLFLSPSLCLCSSLNISETNACCTFKALPSCFGVVNKKKKKEWLQQQQQQTRKKERIRNPLRTAFHVRTSQRVHRMRMRTMTHRNLLSFVSARFNFHSQVSLK